MIDFLTNILELIGKYGLDRVFLVWFFFLYWRSNKRNEKLQDARLEDSKVALEALIEAKHIFAEMSISSGRLNDDLRDQFAEENKQFSQLNDKLDTLINRRKSSKEKLSDD